MAFSYRERFSQANNDYFKSEAVSFPPLDSVTGVASLKISGSLDSDSDRDYFIISTARLIPSAGRSLDDYLIWVKSATGSASASDAYGIRSAKSSLGILPSRIVGRTRTSMPGAYWSLTKSNPDFVVDVKYDRWHPVALGSYTLEILAGPKDYVALDGYVSLPEIDNVCDAVVQSSDLLNAVHTYYEAGDDLGSWNMYRFDALSRPSDLLELWFDKADLSKGQNQVLSEQKWIDVQTSTWSQQIQIKSLLQASSKGERKDADQIEFGKGPQGSILNGGVGDDILWGRAGWDILDGGDGNDNLHGGNGRDILTGGKGRDELWGDFGWNTFTSEIDGERDLIVIKSDELMVNWLYGKAGNNSDGCKCDVIEGLDESDKIKIVGAATSELTFNSNIAFKGVVGIGIYANGVLEALYTGGNLSLNQIRQMTSGDLTGPVEGSYWTW